MLAKDLKIGEYGITESNLKILRVSGKYFYCFATDYLSEVTKNDGLEVEKLENVKIIYDGCPETKSEYPKMMLVSDYNSDYTERFVYGKFKNGYLAQHTCSSNNALFYKFAKDIETEEELVHLTLEDISKGKGVGVNPELIRIKK